MSKGFSRAKTKRSRKPTQFGSHLNDKYANHLEKLRLAGDIFFWKAARPETDKFILSETCTYTPDFFIRSSSFADEAIEVKPATGHVDRLGRWRVRRHVDRDTGVRIKWAASKFPQYDFYLVTFDKRRGWVKTLVPKE